MYHFMQAAFYLPIKIIYPAKFYGRKNMPKGRAVITSNHTSNLDPIQFVINTYEKKYFIAKKELFEKASSKWLVKAMDCIKVDRSSADLTAIKRSLEVLKKDKKLVIYPEGTRSKEEDSGLGEVKNGAAMLAIKSRSPIVPVWIYNKPKVFKMTKVMIGKPYELDQFYGQKLTEEVLEKASQIISDKLNELKEECEEKFKKKKRKNK